MKKRVMTLFLALVMCLGLTVPAMASDSNDNNMAYVVHLTQYSLVGADEATRTSIQNGIYNLLFQAQFRPTEGPTVDGISATFTGTTSEIKKWYPQNKDNYASSVTDAVLGKVNLGVAGKGCVSYARFVTNYIYNTLGTYTNFANFSNKWNADNVKSFIEGYANPGAYMYYTWRQDTTGKKGDHAVAFLGEDAAQNGFYCLSYGGGASKTVGTNHTLEIRYYTYDNFANKQVQANTLSIQQLQGGVYSQGTARPLNRSIQRIGGTTTNNATIADGTYTLTPACAPNACLDVAGGSQYDKANVQIYTNNGSAAQQWQIKAIGDGYYTLTSKVSGKVLDTYYNTSSSGQNVMQFTSKGYRSEQWKFKDAGDGYYYIIPRSNENLCLDVYSAYSSDGTNVQVYTANQSNAQKWKLDKVGESGNSICSEEWIVSIPANYKLLCYSSKDATKNSTYIRAMTSSYKLSCTQKAQLSNGKTRYFFVSGDKKSLWFDFTNSMSVEYIEHPHLKGSFKYFEEEHPHYGHYICSVCGKEFKDNSSTWFTTGCSICVPSATETGNSNVTVTPWSEWSTTPVYASATREVETKTETERVKVSDAHTEYRYGGYVCFDYNDKKHECWCETYMKKRFGSAILRYSDWSTTRYSSTGTGWTCGSSCRGNHIGVDKYKNGTPWWAQYTLPGGEDYFWEESRTVEAQYETRTVTWYRYRDTTSQRVRITS